MKVFSFHQLIHVQKDQADASDYSIVGDFRIDNVNELANKLGTSQNLKVDELLLEAYKKFGQSMVDHLIGAFAFVIYDKKQQQVFCVRDHIGVKPLFYYLDHNRLIVTNRKNEILKIQDVDKTPNWLYITRRIKYSTINENHTEYKCITKLSPAHFLIFENQKIKAINKYWSLDVEQTTQFNKASDYEERFRELFTEAVRCRMQNANLVAAHLSGGLDSSGIAGVAADVCKANNSEIHTLSYTVPENADLTNYKYENENPLIKEQVAFSEIKHAHFIDQPLKFNKADIVNDEAVYCDGFLASNNLATEYEIHSLAQSKNIDVILSGFSGDELVTSFVRPYYLEYLDRGQYLKYLTDNLTGNYKFKERIFPLLLKITKELGLTASQKKAAFWYHNYLLKGQKRMASFHENNLFSKDYIDSNRELKEAFLAPVISIYKHGFPLSLKEYQRNHISRFHTSFRMESENIAGHRFGVEHRYPFSDIRLLQYVLSVPVELKISKEKARLLFRNSMTPYIVPSILDRDNKRGSLKPMNNFMKRNGKSLVKMYNQLKMKGLMDFVNTDKVDSIVRTKKIPVDISKYLLLGKLAELGKMSL